MYHNLWKGMENLARKLCQKLSSFLFEVNSAFGKKWIRGKKAKVGTCKVWCPLWSMKTGLLLVSSQAASWTSRRLQMFGFLFNFLISFLSTSSVVWGRGRVLELSVWRLHLCTPLKKIWSRTVGISWLILFDISSTLETFDPAQFFFPFFVG